jgi:hypothetical protein
MKIALSLFGFFNNSVDPVAGDKGYEYLRDTLLDNNNIDVYIHSWDIDFRTRLYLLYEPVDSIVEPNNNFKQIMNAHGITTQFFDEGFDRENTIFKNAKIENTLSFLYSRKRSLELIPDAAEYDAVISCRFDIGHRGGPEVRYLKFNQDNDMSKIYSAMWNQTNSGYADMWFYSNQENMRTLATAYDKALQYFKPDSEYYNKVTQGWPDSKYHAGGGLTHAKEQFSNERFKPVDQRSADLMRWPKWQCINNHMLYKWFFIDSGLYNKSEFV